MIFFFFSFSTQFISLKLVNESSDLFGQTSNGQPVLIRLRDGRETEGSGGARFGGYFRSEQYASTDFGFLVVSA